MINLITLAGDGSRFAVEGNNLPKPLIPVNGIPMIYRAVDCLPKADKYVFVCKLDHIERFDLDKKLIERYGNVEIITVDKTTMGQACTAELGILNSSINDEDEILISSCDYGLSWNKNQYNDIKSLSDIVVWSTIHNKSFAKDPSSYSWIETSGSELNKVYVKQSKYKDPYNEHAIVGTFYFKKAKYFTDAVKTLYKKNITSNNEFYIDNMFNVIENLTVNIFDVDKYQCWGTPKDLKNYEN